MFNLPILLSYLLFVNLFCLPGLYYHSGCDGFPCRYGCTKVLISDQGREFVNQVSRLLFLMTKTEHRISSAYHPQTNGLVERFNQTIQRSLVKVVNENQTDWDTKLEGVRTSQQKSTRLTPFELMYCR